MNTVTFTVDDQTYTATLRPVKRKEVKKVQRIMRRMASFDDQDPAQLTRVLNDVDTLDTLVVSFIKEWDYPLPVVEESCDEWDTEEFAALSAGVMEAIAGKAR